MSYDPLISAERRAHLDAICDEPDCDLTDDPTTQLAHRYDLTDDDKFFQSVFVYYLTLDDKPATVISSHDQYMSTLDLVYRGEHIPLRDTITNYYASLYDNAMPDERDDLIRRRDADLARLCP